MAEPGPNHRDRATGDLRRLLERFETNANSVGAPGSKVRQRFADDAATLRDAIHYLGADAHLEKAKAVQRTADPTANALIQAMLPDLLIVLVQRAGGNVLVPVDEIDAVPAGKVLDMQVEADGFGSAFRFLVRRKA